VLSGECDRFFVWKIDLTRAAALPPEGYYAVEPLLLPRGFCFLQEARLLDKGAMQNVKSATT
jgi:hypothetical protein